MRALSPLVLAAFVAACSGTTNDTPTDAGTKTDAGTTTNEETDAGTTTDPNVPLDGFGSISGDCGILDDELTSASNYVFVNHLDFQDDPYDTADKALLGDDAERMADTPNAGGSSLLSEVFSLDVMHRCEGAKLLKTETEITYAPTSSKKTDYLAEIDGLKIGVSVTRAVTFPHDVPYTLEAAQTLLAKKLTGITESTAHVVEADKWQKQILSVLALSDQHAEVFKQAWEATDASTRGDTILIITITDGSDEPIYGN